ncbi:MAG: CopG family transcriptional regulator [Phyllobacteriaceae bacterium]|nr:CopG family transcriptional regulator [Phyllobacteriaceae bacterium]
MKPRINVYLEDPIADQLALIAKRPGANKSAIVNAALDRFFNPEPDTQTAALIRRLDRMSKSLDRLDRNTGIGVETLALFIRYFLTVTPPLPANDQAAAHALGRERFKMFVAQVGRRLAQDGNLLSEVLETIADTKPDLFAADSFTMDR